MEYAQQVNRLAGRLRIMGVGFGSLGAIIAILSSGIIPPFGLVLSAALLASGVTAAFVGDYLLRLTRKNTDIDQQTF
ncbi:MAG: hypothetical protein ACU0CC_02390 [Sagittula sp.]|uniref:hypothetical protein n=1 Tax=Sagittula sp. TaxID=2038081 RepID=UPI0040594EF0